MEYVIRWKSEEGYLEIPSRPEEVALIILKAIEEKYPKDSFTLIPVCITPIIAT